MIDFLLTMPPGQLATFILVALTLAVMFLYRICKFLLQFILENSGSSSRGSKRHGSRVGAELLRKILKDREEEELLRQILEDRGKEDVVRKIVKDMEEEEMLKKNLEGAGKKESKKIVEVLEKLGLQIDKLTAELKRR